MLILLLTVWYITDASCTHLLLVMMSVGRLTSRLTSFRGSGIVGACSETQRTRRRARKTSSLDNSNNCNEAHLNY